MTTHVEVSIQYRRRGDGGEWRSEDRVPRLIQSRESLVLLRADVAQRNATDPGYDWRLVSRTVTVTASEWEPVDPG